MFALLLAMFVAVASAGTIYVAPTQLSQVDQAYQIGIWSFIAVALAMIAAAYTIGSIDYSGDTMLHVDLSDQKTEGHNE